MCFETTKLVKARTAKRNIICWKYLDDGNVSPCYPYSYKVNKETESIDLIIKETSESATGCGIKEGYHSYIKKEFAPYWLSRETYSHKFIIPKGTRYFKNKTEYVSETIVLID